MMMMFPRLRRFRSPRPFCRALTSYSSKVQAFPFKVSPAQAIAELGPYVGGITTRIASFWGEDPPAPEKIVPVYFPAWFIDAEVEATFTAQKENGPEEGSLTFVSLNSYLPGHPMDKLSSISLLSEQLGLDSQLPTVPFSADLETQHGTKITCLPFKTMPFSILEAAESLRPDQCVLNETLRIVHPLKIRPNLLCAYPVLIPLYLAQYSTENGNQTAVLEAYNDSGRIIVENVESPILTEYAGEIPADLTKSWLFQKIVPRPMWDSSDFMYHRGFETPFINLAYISIPESWDKSAAESFRKFEHWLRPFTGLQQLVQPGASEMSDPRIRPFIKEEVEGVRNWIEIGEEHTRVRNTSLRKNASEEDLKALKDYTASLKIRREKALPSWWKDWQKSVGVSVAANVRRDERPVDAGAAIENAKDEKQR